MISTGAGTAGAHAGMFLNRRSPAALASVMRSIRPGISAGKPFALVNPEKIGFDGLSDRTNSSRLLSGRRVCTATRPAAMPKASIRPGRSSNTSGRGLWYALFLATT
jgi:hypothetical protein